MKSVFLFLLFCMTVWAEPHISLGVDVFFAEKQYQGLKGKKIAVLTNHTGVDSSLTPTIDLFRFYEGDYKIVALFSPEHGLRGQHYAFDFIKHGEENGIPVYSLHGETRRPTKKMLENVDVLFYDIQCTGVRAYTYPTTLFYMMEAAAKEGIEVVVFDRPNPINGNTVDGPMLEDKWRSFIGYINIPYCHGMTIGELATFFNEEYKVGCKLRVVSMKDWKRSMTYRDTGLSWIPPSPNVPDADTPLFCPMTGIMGECHLLNIGIGFTMPFKVVGAPWIEAKEFSDKLNAQKLPGIRFHPFYFRPFYGLYKGLDCQGVLLYITDLKAYRPLAVQYLLLGMVKSLYPKEFSKRIVKSNRDLFSKANGTDAIYEILVKEKYPAWKLIDYDKEEREAFLEKRKKYLLY
jgi:uncharacterized protein YbbC (DUF1343 family)